MQILKLVAVVVAAALAAASYLQEWHRLTVVKRLPGREARAYYEIHRRRSDRAMVGVAVLFGCLALGAIVYLNLAAAR